jgi:hypothetical protein
MNVLYLHFMDQESFSLKSESNPLLAKAAINTGWQYSHEDVKETVQFAWERGVRVIPEFETPGHSQSFAKADPRLASKCPIVGPSDPLHEYGGLIHAATSRTRHCAACWTSSVVCFLIRGCTSVVMSLAMGAGVVTTPYTLGAHSMVVRT